MHRTLLVAMAGAALTALISPRDVQAKNLLEGDSPGRFTVQVSTSVLNEQTIDPAMTSCDAGGRVADILLTGGQTLQDWAPAYFFFNGPYVILDYDHFLRVRATRTRFVRSWRKRLHGARHRR
jgi:TRAP-type C4-dicarboxylate transport system substrate-binding protein